MLVAIAIKIEVVAVSRLNRRLLAAATTIMVAILSFAIAPGTAHAADTGAITVDGTVATRYDAYQLFSATVVDDAGQKIATDVTWANDTVRQTALSVLHDAGLDSSTSTAQEAAEWMNADGHMTTALTAKLARAIVKAGAVSVALNAGTTAELSCGYWLIVADDDAIAQGEVGTAPIVALVGGSAVAVKPKAATPKVAKHVLEDSTAAWQKAADATVGDDLYWRLSATVPAGLTAYDTYTVQFVDTMSAGLDPSKAAASMRVYVAAGATAALTPSHVRAVTPTRRWLKGGRTLLHSAGSRSRAKPSLCAPATWSPCSAGPTPSPRAPAWLLSTMRRWGPTAIEAPPRATPTRSTCFTRALLSPTSPVTPASPARRAMTRAPIPGDSV